jgi:hypothetical protein
MAEVRTRWEASSGGKARTVALRCGTVGTNAGACGRNVDACACESESARTVRSPTAVRGRMNVNVERAADRRQARNAARAATRARFA